MKSGENYLTAQGKIPMMCYIEYRACESFKAEVGTGGKAKVRYKE